MLREIFFTYFIKLEPIISGFRTNKLIRFVCYPIILSRRAVLKYKNRRNEYYKDLFSNVLEGSMVVTIKDIPGIFEIGACSSILQRILINKNYEPDVVSAIKKYSEPNKDAINIGANIGIFAILLANLINSDRKVLAIEPTPLAFKYLKNNLNRNKLDSKVLLFNGICNDKQGKYNLNIIQGKEEFSSIGESIHQSATKQEVVKIEVDGDTINNLVIRFNLKPGTIVMDVEGAEMKVLEGAALVLEQYKPIIILELHGDLLNNQNTSSKEVIDFLIGLGYNIKNTDNGRVIRYPYTGSIIAFPV